MQTKSIPTLSRISANKCAIGLAQGLANFAPVYLPVPGIGVS